MWLWEKRKQHDNIVFGSQLVDKTVLKAELREPTKISITKKMQEKLLYFVKQQIPRRPRKLQSGLIIPVCWVKEQTRKAGHAFRDFRNLNHYLDGNNIKSLSTSDLNAMWFSTKFNTIILLIKKG